MKKALSILIVICILFGIIIYCDFTINESIAATNYNADAAIEYAADHATDTPSIAGADCANFVSKCVTAGGIPVSKTVCIDLKNALEPYAATVTTLETVPIGSGSSRRVPTGGSNARILSKGDVMFVCCSRCRATGNNYERHAVIYSGDCDNNGYAKCYAHTSMCNNGTFYVGYNGKTACSNGHETKYLEAEVVHFGAKPTTHTRDTNYGTNFTTYLKDPNNNHYVFYDNHSNTGGYINDVDPVTIHEVYTDGCCKLSYITSSGATKTAYGKISWFNIQKDIPNYSHLSIDTTTPHIGDTLTFTCDGDSPNHNITHYTIKFFQNGERILQKKVPHIYYHKCEIAGTYSVYVSSVNENGWCDSNVIEFTVSQHKYSADTFLCTYGCGSYNSASVTTTSTAKTLLTVKTDSVSHTGPYGDCPVTESYKSGKQLTAVATVRNGFNNTWYKLENGHFIYSNYVAAHTTHTWDSGKVTKAATCAATGVKTYTCTVCNTTKTEAIAKLTTHTWDGGKVTNAATYFDTGIRTYTCTVCKTTKTEAIAKLALPDSPALVKQVSNNGHTYSLYASKLNWNGAKAWCERNGGYLCTITTAAEQNIVQGLINGNTVRAWMGAEDETTGSFRWLTCEPWSYTNWDTDEPNNMNGVEHCLAIHPNYKWNDYSKSSPTPTGFIMETGSPSVSDADHLWDEETVTKNSTYFNAGEKTITCTACGAKKTEEIPILQQPESPVLIESIENNGHTYSLFASGFDWNAAQNWCDQNGGYLVTITNGAESDLITELLTRNQAGKVWLGAEDETTANYRWVTCEEWDYTNWGNNQPNGKGEAHFISVLADGKWNDFMKETPSNGFIMEIGDTPNAAHIWNSGKITKPATTSSTGIKTFTCTVCGNTKTEVIPKIPETWKKGQVKNLKAVTVSVDKAALTWDAVPGAERYMVYYATDKDGEYKAYATPSATSYTFNKTNASAMYYKVRAFVTTDGAKVYGAYSEAVRSLPGKVGNLNATIAADNKVTLTWDAVPGAERYMVYYATDKGGEYKAYATPAATSYTFNKTGASTMYYKVRAFVTADGAKVYGAYSEAVRSLPGKVGNLNATIAANNKVTLTWDTVPGAERYMVYYATDKDGEYKAYATPTATSYTFSKAGAGALHYKVRAFITVNGARQYGVYSEAVRGVPGKVGNLNATIMASSKVTLTWDAVPGAEKYMVYYATAKDGPYTAYATPSGTSYTFSKTGASALFYKVRAFVAVDGARQYGEDSAAVRCFPGQVTNLNATMAGTTKTTLAWDAVPGAERYMVYFSTEKDGIYTAYGHTTASSYTFTRSNASTLYYKVRAFVTVEDKREYGDYSAAVQPQ